MNDDKKIRARIRALLALADDPGASESERQVAFERASAMMARHAIERLDTAPTRRADRVVKRHCLDIPGGRSTPSYAQTLGLGIIAEAAGMRSTFQDWRKHRGRPFVRLFLVAFESDIEWFTALASAVVNRTAQGWCAWRRAHADAYRYWSASERLYTRNGYVEGFARGVAELVEASRAQAVSEPGRGDRALIVRTREQEVEAFFNDLDLVDGKPCMVDEAAYSRGVIDGRNSGLSGATTVTRGAARRITQ